MLNANSTVSLVLQSFQLIDRQPNSNPDPLKALMQKDASTLTLTLALTLTLTLTLTLSLT